MNNDLEITLDQRLRLAQLFNSLPTTMLVTEKNRVNRIKYDNPDLAEKAFKTSFETVIRKSFEAPKSHHSMVIDKPNARPVIVKPTKVNVKGRQNLYLRWNDSLKRLNERQNTHTLVYEKITNKLRFSGDIYDAIDYIVSMQRAKIWNETSWVVYLSSKVYQELNES